MSFRLNIFPRAERDAQHIFDWLSERSRQGALAWWSAFEFATTKLLHDPYSFGHAPEDHLVDIDLRQVLFKTRRGLS